MRYRTRSRQEKEGGEKLRRPVLLIAALFIAVTLTPFIVSDGSDADYDVPTEEGIVITYRIAADPYGTEHGQVEAVSSAPYSGAMKPLIIPETVEIESNTYDVVNIGENCFKDQSRIESVTIPSTVSVIGKNAFYGCYNVKEIHINSSNPDIQENAFCLGINDTYKAECSIYGFTPIRDVGTEGNPYEDIFGKYTTVKYMDVQPNSREAIIHIVLISIGVLALLYMGRCVKVKKIKRKKIKKKK